MKNAFNVKPVLLKQNAPQMDASMKDALNVKPCLLKQNAPQIDAFMKDVLNVKPVLLKQNATLLLSLTVCQGLPGRAGGWCRGPQVLAPLVCPLRLLALPRSPILLA